MFYTEKTKVAGSLFQKYALLSKLSDELILKKIQFVNPIIDDLNTTHKFVKISTILFIGGLAVSASKLDDFLDNAIDNVIASDRVYYYYDMYATLLEELEKIGIIVAQITFDYKGHKRVAIWQYDSNKLSQFKIWLYSNIAPLELEEVDFAL
jgi:hypothetical protein